MNHFCITLVSFLLISCADDETSSIKKFIPGTYVRSDTNEFGTIADTITIQLQNADVHSFVIEQRWTYERVLDGVAQEPEYKIITDQAIYNPEKKLLQNQRNLLNYSFDLKKQVVYFGTLRFKKIK